MWYYSIIHNSLTIAQVIHTHWPLLNSFFQDNGGAPYNRPVVDDFLSEDAQFVWCVRCPLVRLLLSQSTTPFTVLICLFLYNRKHYKVLSASNLVLFLAVQVYIYISLMHPASLYISIFSSWLHAHNAIMFSACSINEFLCSFIINLLPYFYKMICISRTLSHIQFSAYQIVQFYVIYCLNDTLYRSCLCTCRC